MSRFGLWTLGGLLFLVFLLSFPRLLSRAQGPKAALLTMLKASEEEGLELPVLDSGVPLRSTRHQFQRMHVELANDGQSAFVTATLDFTGKWGGTEVSSLGYERIGFVLQNGEWRPSKSMAPQLVQTVELLEKRRRAVESASLSSLKALFEAPGAPSPAFEAEFMAVQERRYKVSAWYIRNEKTGGAAREEYRFTGKLPDRPVDEKSAQTLEWVPVGESSLLKGPLR